MAASPDIPLAWLLHKVVFRLRPSFLRLGEHYDLTLVQLHIILSIQPNTPVPMHIVSEVLMCDASNITGVVERLVARGLLSRYESPEDRRVKLLSLTEAGEAIRNQLTDGLQSEEIPELSSLSSDEQTQLVRLLDKITV